MRKVVNLFTGTDACAAVCSALVHLRYKDRDSITVKYCDSADIEIHELLNLIESAESISALPDIQRDIIVCGTNIRNTTESCLHRFCCRRNNVNLILINPDYPIPFECAFFLYYKLFEQESGAPYRFVCGICGGGIAAQKLDALGSLLPPQTLELVISNHFSLFPNEVFSPEKWLLNLIENQALPIKKGFTPDD